MCSLVSGDTQVLKDEGSVQEEQVVGICDTAACKHQRLSITRMPAKKRGVAEVRWRYSQGSKAGLRVVLKAALAAVANAVPAESSISFQHAQNQ